MRKIEDDLDGAAQWQKSFFWGVRNNNIFDTIYEWWGYNAGCFQKHMWFFFCFTFIYFLDSFTIWLGGYDRDNTDVYFWVDDTQLDDGYTNWYRTQPNHGSNTYVNMGNLNSYDGVWFDAAESQTGHFLCEKN